MTQVAFEGERARRLARSYLSADMRAQRAETLRLLALKPGEAVIDVGCGPGFLCEQMADQVGPSGSVLGTDVSRDLLDVAAARNERPWLTYARTDAAALDVPDQSFDVAVCVQVLEYVPDVERALREMNRALRAGGRLLIVDTDWDGVVWHSADRERMQRMLRAWESHCADPRLPRTLASRLGAAGFRIDGVSGWAIVNASLDWDSYSYGLARLIEDFVVRHEKVPREEAAAWAAEQRALGESGQYFFSTTRHFFCASKPASL
jgi:ubiquinone/menaquinone biosynthesis C-methylase UbiE